MDGIDDPDPLADGKDIEFLLEKNVAVDLFDRDLQEIILKDNTPFIEGAEYRARKDKSIQERLSGLDKPVLSSTR